MSKKDFLKIIQEQRKKSKKLQTCAGGSEKVGAGNRDAREFKEKRGTSYGEAPEQPEASEGHEVDS